MRSPARALVSDLDVARRGETARVLSGAGFEVVEGDWAGFSPDFDIAVLDASVATPQSVAEQCRHHDSGRAPGGRLADFSHETPLVFLADEVDHIDPAALNEFASAEYAVRPFGAPELLHRVRSLVDWADRRARAQNDAEELRQKARDISQLIWSTNDPERMAAALVTGTRSAFGADGAYLTTFLDDRVPQLELGARTDRVGSVTDSRAAERAAEQLAGRLWDAETSQVVRATEVDSTELVRTLGQHLPTLTTGSALIVPIGQGKKPFGLLLVFADDPEHVWSPLERSLIQHICSNLAHALMQGHQIAVQQQVVTRLHQLDKERDDMLATVNHELRTPLTSIVAYLELVRDGEGGEIPQAASDMLGVVERNAARLRSLIEDALALSGSTPSRVPGRTRVDVGVALQSVMGSLWPLSSARGVFMSAGEWDQSLFVEGDENDLERVFTNIIGNAVKFSPDGGSVTVTLSEANRPDGTALVSISVTDQGVGIPENEIPRLFTRFFRASNATRAAIPGTGLGLAIAQDILSRHGGSIAVSSVVGAGTTVTMLLPRSNAELLV